MTITSKPAPDGIDITHQAKVFHVKGEPISCIIDQNPLNKSRYDSFNENPDLMGSLNPIVVESEDYGFVIIIQLKIKSLDDFFEYTVLPDDEFIDVLIKTGQIVFVDNQLKAVFTIGKLNINGVIELKQKLNERRAEN